MSPLPSASFFLPPPPRKKKLRQANNIACANDDRATTNGRNLSVVIAAVALCVALCLVTPLYTIIQYSNNAPSSRNGRSRALSMAYCGRCRRRLLYGCNWRLHLAWRQGLTVESCRIQTIWKFLLYCRTSSRLGRTVCRLGRTLCVL